MNGLQFSPLVDLLASGNRSADVIGFSGAEVHPDASPGVGRLVVAAGSVNVHSQSTAGAVGAAGAAALAHAVGGGGRGGRVRSVATRSAVVSRDI